jgi:hypothetical protein
MTSAEPAAIATIREGSSTRVDSPAALSKVPPGIGLVLAKVNVFRSERVMSAGRLPEMLSTPDELQLESNTESVRKTLEIRSFRLMSST